MIGSCNRFLDGNGAVVSAPLCAKPTSPDSSTNCATPQFMPSPSSVDLRSPGTDANAAVARPVRWATSGTLNSPIPPSDLASLLSS